MSSLVSNLVSNVNHNHQTNPGASHPNALSIHKTPLHMHTFEIVPFGPAHVQASLYTAKISPSTKPRIQIFKHQREVFTANAHSLSSRMDLFVNGQPMLLTRGQLSGSFNIQHPTLGELKWKLNQLTGTSAELVDAQETKIAKLSKNHVPGMGEQKIELFVPCDPAFLDLVVGTAVTVKSKLRSMSENAAEIVGAIAGGA